MKINFPIIYPITDTAISGLSTREQVDRMIAGGASVIQIREKNASSKEFFESARASVEHARAHDVIIIINDRVDIAMLVNADGVHLGQNDISPVHARRLLGDEAVIGYSTHTLQQAAEAVKLPIDYLAFGPVFLTSTKENPDPAVGLELLAQAKAIAGRLPLVAIGGIDGDVISDVLKAGADSCAMIGGILAEPDMIEAKVRSFLSPTANP